MDNLGILIQAILSLKDTTDSKNQIAKELPKLESQLQSDKNTRVKIVAGLDISKSKSLIQSQLNTLANQAKAPTIKIGVDTSGLNSVQGATHNITNSLQTVQTQAQQTASAIKEVTTSVSYNISDNAFNRLLKDMQIGKNVTDEYKASIRTLANELNESWNTYNLDKYNKTLDTLITTLNNGQAKMRSFTSDSNELNRVTEELKMYQSAIGSFTGKANKLKFYIDSSFRKELEYLLGSSEKLKSTLTSMYGVGNWTFDPKKQINGFENLLNYIDKSDAGFDHFGRTLLQVFSSTQAGGNNFASFFVDVANKVTALRDTLKFKATPISEIFSSTDTATATRAIEDMIAQAINLSNYEERNRDVFRGFYEEVTTDSGIIVNDLNNIAVAAGNVQRAANQIYIEGWGWVEEVVAEDNQVASSLNTVGKEARETAVALGEIGHNFISNNQVQATFSSIKQAEEYFKGLNLGNVSLSLNKGSLQGLTDFTVKIKSATGEVERFRYAVNNIGDDQNPILEYNLTNINASNEAVQRLIQSQQKAQDKVKALRIDLASTLKSIGTGYSDPNSGKPIVDDKHLESLNTQYVHALRTIAELKNADDTTMASMKANAEKEIDTLKRMVREYQNAEYAATSLRTKDIGTIKINQTNELNAFIAQINNAKIPLDTMTKDVEELKTALNNIGDKDSLTKFLNQFDNAKTKFESVKSTYKTLTDSIKQLQNLQNSTTFNKNVSDPQVTQTKQQIAQLIAEYQKLMTQMQGNITPAGLESIGNQLTQLNARFNDTTATAQRFEQSLKDDNGAEKLAQRIALLKARLESLAKANPKALKQFGNEINSLMATLNSNPDARAVEQVAKSVQLLRKEINNADLAGKTFFQNLKEKVAKFTGWMSMTYAISLVTRTIRSMITEVVNLDTALIDLKKTFKGTNSDLQDFYYEANNIAKQLGVTTEEVINSASSWSRLGYNTKQTAVEMAKAASIMKMISPNMDIDTANSGLVSIVKAFSEIDVGNILNEVISPINEVGNNFAVSNNDILEGLQRSSAAMKMMGEDLTSTIALFTAGKFCCLYVQKCA